MVLIGRVADANDSVTEKKKVRPYQSLMSLPS